MAGEFVVFQYVSEEPQVDELREDVVLNMLAIHPKKRCVLKKLEEQYERRIHHAKQSV